MRPTALAVLAVLMAYGGDAAAEPARVKLTYTKGDGPAATCPDEPTFRTLVLARLGYDPFDGAGSLVLRVDLRPAGQEVVGRLELTGKPGDRPANRTLRSGDADCFELASSLALAAAIAVDPDAVRAGGPAPSPPDPPRPGPTAPPPSAPPRPTPTTAESPAESPWALLGPGARLSASFVLPVGLTPAPRGGVRIGAGLDGGVASIAAEGAVLFPSSASSAFGEVSSWVLHGSLVPCAHLPLHEVLRLDLCAVGSIGVMSSDASKVTQADPQSHLYAALGPRAGLTLFPWPSVGFALSLDAPILLERPHLVIEDQGELEEVWAASRIGFVGGLGMVFRLR